jgi:uncharacterized membrane protein YphA (DoxX/SURF4 family)
VALTSSLEIALRLALGSVFFFSALPKLRRPRSFVLVVLEYQILPTSLGRLFGLSLPVLELLAAVFLLTGTAVRVAAICLFILLCLFIYAVSVNVLRGADLKCNCFGAGKKRKVGGRLLAQDIALVCLAGLLVTIASWSVTADSWSAFQVTGTMTAHGMTPIAICLISTLIIALVFPRARGGRYYSGMVVTQVKRRRALQRFAK